VQFSSMDSIAEGKPVCLLGVKLHILTQGATFNLHTRQADAGALQLSKQ
jgi:cyanophycinase